MPVFDFTAIASIINKGKTYPAIDLVRDNPNLAATLSKLVTPRDRSAFDTSGQNQIAQQNRSTFEQRSAEITEKTQDGQNLTQLFPDMELAAQILISSIISPKDMAAGDIIYTVPDGLITPELNTALITHIKKHLDESYKIKQILPKMLREVLFGSGSYPIAVIPESSLDDIINGQSKASMESLSEYVNDKGVPKNIGLLGTTKGTPVTKTNYGVSLETFKEYSRTNNYSEAGSIPALESYFKESFFKNIRVIDNPQFLKFPAIARVTQKERIKDLLNNHASKSLGFENFSTTTVKKLSAAQMQSLVYKSRSLNSKAVIKVSTAKGASRNTIGNPLIMLLPSESVIPVHVPGNEEHHVGYFILIDIDGNPIRGKTNVNAFGNLQNGNANSSMSSVLQSKAIDSINGYGRDLNQEAASRLFTDIVESDLISKLQNGVYGSNVSISRNEEVYRIMFARALANQTTQMLYMPCELVTYFAYKYDKNGIGKSLLDDMRVLNSLRAMMLFSRVMATLKNSIGRTAVKLKFDERDPDPAKTAEIAMTEIAKTRQAYFPLGINSPNDLVDWIKNSGFEFTFEGHPKMPDTSFEFNEKQSNYAKPDGDLDDELKKRSIQGVGLSPETVDNGMASEFATTVVSQNILLAKRVSQIQEHISPQLTDHARKVIINNGILVKELYDIIDKNYESLKPALDGVSDLENMNEDGIKRFILDWFLDSFELGLPQPNSITLENQMNSFDIYATALDKALDAWVNTNIINSNMSGGISDNIENFKAIIKGYYLRKFMADNNIMPELNELTTKDSSGKPSLSFFDIQKTHINGLVQSAIHLYKGTKDMANAADADIKKISDGDGIEESTPPEDSQTTNNEGVEFEDDFSMSDEPANLDPSKSGKDLPDLGKIE
jgi:hypothetical protein